jgi:DNA (cytosine-5)-methyltransferase 1
MVLDGPGSLSCGLCKGLRLDDGGEVTLGSLFAGIGGFDLGFERAGFETVWQVEIDEYCRRVLERHFPRAERFADIRDCGAHNLKPVDVICGGFPCQDISDAGKRAGIDAERSGLWSEMRRIIGELRPPFAVVENVSALLGRGMERVLGDLAALGYDAEWDCFRASEFGAPHDRERVFICAYSNRNGLEAYSDETVLCKPFGDSRADGYVSSMGRENVWASTRPLGARPMGVGNGIPADVDRLKCLGNAVVPQIAQWIAERIKAVSHG